jgi:HD-GYP domain-containing protein (c-di-GMP phosphodiesterase class II)
VLLQALYERDPDLQLHLEDVTRLAVTIGQKLGLSDRELEELHRAAQLHDIGKIAIPDAILHKPEPLSDEDWAFVRQHTVIGERILGASPALRAVAPIVRASHERWDGSGYPDGLPGPEIPLAARIIAACDAVAAMTAPRPYREPLDSEGALAELERCSGTQFDPTIVALVVEVVRGGTQVSTARA